MLGLALQNSLSDLFSGVAIGIDWLFGVGDIVLIEGSAERRVIEIYWRSTRIQTGANDIGPSPAASWPRRASPIGAPPSEVQNTKVKVKLDPPVLPDAIAMLHASALNTASIPANQPIGVAYVDLLGDGSVYEIQFLTLLTRLLDVDLIS